jgi:hypothetical protein
MLKTKVIMGLLLLFVLVSCAGLPEAGPAAVVIDAKDGTSISDSSYMTKRKGEACSYNVLGLVAIGDQSIESAMANGNITKVSHIDKNIWAWNIYIALGKSCTVVYGE